MSEYPEHDKLAKISDLSQACYDFITWLEEEKHAHLCEIPREFDHTWFPIQTSMQKLLAEHFCIDLDKIEAEKRAMLARLAEAGAKRGDTT